MTSSVDISIIIPVYNVERYVRDCVDSILGQSFGNFELILVDDGSKDQSGNICDEYAAKDNRITVVHQQNAGVSSARNAALSLAKGKWITFIDSDDWVDAGFLENFHLDKNEDADMVCQGLKYIDDKTMLEKKRTQFRDTVIVAPDEDCQIVTNNVLEFGVTVCKCFKQNIIKDYDISFNPEISYHEDHLFTFDYISHTRRIALVSECGYNYRCGHNPQSLSKRRHSWQSQEKASKRLMSKLKEISTIYNLESEYMVKMSSFCLGPRVNAVIGMYNDESVTKKRKAMLSTLEPLDDIRGLYRAGSVFKIIPLLAYDKTGTLLHLFFAGYSKIKGK